MVFPARAGMIPLHFDEELNSIGIPRESGDDPAINSDRILIREYSPRERG